MTEPIVALAGVGRWGKNLLRALHTTGALKYVCDRSAEVLEEVQGRYPDLNCGSDFYALLQIPSITAVVIASPASLHPQMVKEALEAGKDVFVEKPLAFDADTALMLTLLAEERERVLMTGHLLQYHPVFNELLRIVRSGELGALFSLTSNRLSTGPIRHEENALWNFAPHDVSMILALHSDAIPSQVRAVGGCYISPGVVDSCHVTLSFSDRSHATIHNSWLHPYKEHRLSAVGEEGMAIFDDTRVWEEKLVIQRQFLGRDQLGRPQIQESIRDSVVVESREPLLDECVHFVECCRKRIQPRTDGWEALRVTAVIEAAQRSLDMGGEAVRVQLPERDKMGAGASR